MTEAFMTPDFLIIPYVVKACRKLRPTDGDVYAVVYWFEHMKDGQCRASNQVIAKIARCTERAVQAALQRLEQNGFLECVYQDESRRVRSEIKTKVRYARVEEGDTKKLKPKEMQQVEPEVDESGEPTPKTIAKDFFAPPGTTATYRDGIIESLVTNGYEKEFIIQEARKFYAYWTELSTNGKKQRWEGERYFDVRRRLATWIAKAGQFTKTERKTAGAGQVL